MKGTSKLGRESEEGSTSLSRRGFLGRCASIVQGITVVGIVAPIVAACGDDTPTNNNNNTGQKTFDVSSLTADGQGLLTSQKGSDNFAIMIVRVSDGNYKALSTRCTHESCDVDLPSNNKITCPCHGSQYALDGTVTGGPAAANLKSYQLTYNATDKTVTVTVT